MEFSLVLTALSKLITLGMAANRSAASPKGFDRDDLDTLKTALDTGSWLSGSWPRKEISIGAKYLALVSRAFGAALGRYWVSPHALDQDVIRRCLEQAELRRADPGALPANADALRLVQALGQDPMRSPYYTALWDAFSRPLPIAGRDALAPLGQDRREFERHFREAYREALATHGQDVQQWRLSLAQEEAPELLREIVAEDMACWGNNHVFGNVRPNDASRQDESIPFLALDRMYVEPRARHEDHHDHEDHEDQGDPILALLRGALREHRVVVITADFGHGKSLTARRLARDLAREWLDSDQPGPSTPYPVFIACTRDVRDRDYRHDTSVRRALWNNGNDALGRRQGKQQSMEDPMFAPLQGDRAAVFVLDGLDEISLTPNQLDDLFRSLDETMGSDQRAVIFTRPGALHDGRRLPEGTPVIALQGFAADQVNQWIERWNQVCGTAVQPERLQELGLHELAATPILLFMIALTWGEHAVSAQGVDKTAIYESFFRHIARGKYEREKEHPTIARASRALIKALEERRLIEQDAGPVDAMLWLMARVAWQAHMHAYAETERPLKTHDIARLIEDELGIQDDAVVEIIQMGVLLAMQIDPTGRQQTILFGHKSFREFLVARYWRDQLCALVHDGTKRDRQADIEKQLMQAQLLQFKDQAFSLLMEMLRRLDERTRERIRNWAKRCVESGAIRLDHRDKDLHPMLRESALAIGSHIDPEQGMEIDEWALRYLYTWFQFHEQPLEIWAPRLKAPRSHLAGVNLVFANLSGADLRGANLRGANLIHANLMRARLDGADLSDADLTDANLGGATLDGANLSNANLSGAVLNGADLCDANLGGATLDDADLSNANLRGADLCGADLSHADLSHADLTYADLGHVNLSHATVERERLEQARHWERTFGLDTIEEPGV